MIFTLTAGVQASAEIQNDYTIPCGRKVTLKAGTIVILETNETFNSDNVTVGQALSFKVRTNVVVDGETTIRTGAMASGRVKKIAETTYNAPAKITIELQYVQAVDGQMVALDGDPLTIEGTYPNEGSQVKTATTITARVMNDIKIRTK